MNTNDTQKPENNFLNTEGGKTKSNAIDIPAINLPKGGGAIKGIDEKFTVNAVNGTTSYSVQLPVGTTRGMQPSLSLSYSSGSGNSIFGLGWNHNLPSIKRKTDKGLPQYLDAQESDTYLLSDAEDLVPEFQKHQMAPSSKTPTATTSIKKQTRRMASTPYVTTGPEQKDFSPT